MLPRDTNESPGVRACETRFAYLRRAFCTRKSFFTKVEQPDDIWGHTRSFFLCFDLRDFECHFSFRESKNVHLPTKIAPVSFFFRVRPVKEGTCVPLALLHMYTSIFPRSSVRFRIPTSSSVIFSHPSFPLRRDDVVLRSSVPYSAARASYGRE
jgi:hypothetical protein